MQIPLQVTFRGLQSSEALRFRIERKVQKLEQHFGHLNSGRVVVEASHQSRGGPFRVTVELSAPGSWLPVACDAHEDVHIALRGAFNAIERRLAERARRRQGDQRRREAGALTHRSW
jgi:ribosomal subunit interface protein